MAYVICIFFNWFLSVFQIDRYVIAILSVLFACYLWGQLAVWFKVGCASISQQDTRKNSFIIFRLNVFFSFVLGGNQLAYQHKQSGLFLVVIREILDHGLVSHRFWLVAFCYSLMPHNLMPSFIVTAWQGETKTFLYWCV